MTIQRYTGENVEFHATGDLVSYEDYAELKEEYERLDTSHSAALAKIDALAAENAALKESREVLSKNALETCNEIYRAGYRNTALHDGLMESTGNRNKYPNPIRTLVDEAKRNIKTPATDAILASLRAEGVDMAMEAAKPEVASEFQRETFDQCVTAAVKYPQSDLAGKVEMLAWLELFAAQLRSKSEVQS